MIPDGAGMKHERNYPTKMKNRIVPPWFFVYLAVVAAIAALPLLLRDGTVASRVVLYSVRWIAFIVASAASAQYLRLFFINFVYLEQHPRNGVGLTVRVDHVRVMGLRTLALAALAAVMLILCMFGTAWPSSGTSVKVVHSLLLVLSSVEALDLARQFRLERDVEGNMRKGGE